jgi:hypothetical protein
MGSCLAVECARPWDVCNPSCPLSYNPVNTPALGGGTPCTQATGDQRQCLDGMGTCVVQHCAGTWADCPSTCGVVNYTISAVPLGGGTQCPFADGASRLCNAVTGDGFCPACSTVTGGLSGVSLQFVHSTRSAAIDWTISALSGAPVCQGGNYSTYSADQDSTNCCLTSGTSYTLTCTGGADAWDHAHFFVEGNLVRCNNFIGQTGSAVFTASPSPPPATCTSGFASMNITTAGGRARVRVNNGWTRWQNRYGRQFGWSIKPLPATPPTPTPAAWTVTCTNWQGRTQGRPNPAPTMVTADGQCVGRANRHTNNERCSITATGSFTTVTPFFNIERRGTTDCYDYVTINSTRYCSGVRRTGSTSPPGNNDPPPTGLTVTPGTTISWYSDGSVDRDPGWLICSAEGLAAQAAAHRSSVTCESLGAHSGHQYVYSNDGSIHAHVLHNDFYAYGDRSTTAITDCCMTPGVTYELDCFSSRGIGWGAGSLNIEGTALCDNFQAPTTSLAAGQTAAALGDGQILTKTFSFGYGNVSLTGVRDVCGDLNGDGSRCAGCRDPLANNTDLAKPFGLDTLCTYVYGCTDSGAVNYHPLAVRDDGSCSCGSGYTFTLGRATSRWLGGDISISSCTGYADAARTGLLPHLTVTTGNVGKSFCVNATAGDALTVSFNFSRTSSFQWHNLANNGQLSWTLANSSGGVFLTGAGSDGVHAWTTCSGSCPGNDLTLHLSDSNENGWDGNGRNRQTSHITVQACPAGGYAMGNDAPPITDPITLGRAGNYTSRSLCLSSNQYIFNYVAAAGADTQNHYWWVTSSPTQNATTAFVPVSSSGMAAGTTTTVNTCTDCNGNAYPNNAAVINQCGVCGIGLPAYQRQAVANTTAISSIYTQSATWCNYRFAPAFASLNDAMMACGGDRMCTGVYDPGCNNVGNYYLCASESTYAANTYSCSYRKDAAATDAWLNTSQTHTCIGCTNPLASNYDPTAALDFGCNPVSLGNVGCNTTVQGTIPSARGLMGARRYYTFTLAPGERKGFSTCGSDMMTKLAVTTLNGTVLQEADAAISHGYGAHLGVGTAPGQCPMVCNGPSCFVSPTSAELITDGTLCTDPAGCTLLIMVRSYSYTSTWSLYTGAFTLKTFCAGCMDPTASNFDALARFDVATVPDNRSVCTFVNNTDCVGSWQVCDVTCADISYSIAAPVFGYGRRCPHRHGDVQTCGPGDGLCPNTPNCSLAAFADHSSWNYRMTDGRGDGWGNAVATIYDCNGMQRMPLPGLPTVTMPSTFLGEGFEGTVTNGRYSYTGSWTGVRTSYGFGWRPRSGRTTSSSTGPNGASEGSHYAYLEVSPPGAVAALTSPTFTAGTYNDLTLKYHMYGNRMGTLSVELYNGTWTTVFTRSGQQHSSYGSPWTLLNISMPADVTQARIRGRRRASGSALYRGDMAVDDIKLNADDHHVQDHCLPPSAGYTVVVAPAPPPPLVNVRVFGTVPNTNGCRGTKVTNGGACLEVVGRTSDGTSTQTPSANYRDSERCTVDIVGSGTLVVNGSFATETYNDFVYIGTSGSNSFNTLRRSSDAYDGTKSDGTVLTGVHPNDQLKWMTDGSWCGGSPTCPGGGWTICEASVHSSFTEAPYESDLYIGQIADPNDNPNPATTSFIQLINPTLNAISLAPYTLGRYTNGNDYLTPTTRQTWTSGTAPSIPPGGRYTICASVSAFAAAYGADSPNITWSCDLHGATGGVADSNGDDNFQLLKNGALVDTFGRPGQDGSGTDHEFEDGQALRIVPGPSKLFQASDWQINCDSSQCTSVGRGPLNTVNAAPKTGTDMGYATFECSGVTTCSAVNTTTDPFSAWSKGQTFSATRGWLRHNLPPTSGSTGPGAAAFGSWFYYFETSAAGGFGTGSASYLYSPLFTTGRYTSASFYYHMYGSTMGTLSAQTCTSNATCGNTAGCGSTCTTKWSATGQQHTSRSAPWSNQWITIGTTDKRLQFKGTKGPPVGYITYRGDMAIDEIRLFGDAITGRAAGPACPAGTVTTGR